MGCLYINTDLNFLVLKILSGKIGNRGKDGMIPESPICTEEKLYNPRAVTVLADATPADG